MSNIAQALRTAVVKSTGTYLESVHGEKNVSGEQDCGNGTHIDIAVKNGSRYIYYEIKTGLSARSCIREAFGQLMEYAFWPGAREAQELTIVGEPCLDKDARKYLERLRKKFKLPLTYQQFDLTSGRLVP